MSVPSAFGRELGAVELPAQLAMIVDLPVVGNHPAAVRRSHRLMPLGRQVDDCQPPVRKPYAGVGVDPGAAIVRTAMGEPIDQPLDELRPAASATDQTYDTAHSLSAPLRV